MKKILFILGLFMAFAADSQPLNYTRISNRYRWVSGMFDSALYVPRYNGTPSGVRVGENSAIDGAIAIDTANSRAYMYSGGAWVRLANYSEIGGTYTAGDGLLLTASDFKVLTKRSITIDSDSLMLVNDTTATPANYFYGMNSAGRRTWLPQSGLVGVNIYNSDGTLDGNRTVATNGNSLTISGEGNKSISVDDGSLISEYFAELGRLQLEVADIADAANGSRIEIEKDSIRVNPREGVINIDTLRTWSAVADTTHKKPMTWDTRNGRWEYASNWFGGGSTYTASNGITLSGSNFKLGGTLVDATTTIDADGKNLTISDGAAINITGSTDSKFEVVFEGSTHKLEIGESSIGINSTDALGNGSDIMLLPKKMYIRPSLDSLFIDSLGYTLSTTGKKIMLRDTATGLVQNIDPSLLSGTVSPGSQGQIYQTSNGAAAWKYDTTTLVTFTAGANFAADTAAFTDSTIYGSFKLMGNDTFYVTGVSVVLYSNNAITDTLGIQITYNDTINVIGSHVFASTYAVNNGTTGQDATSANFTGSASVPIPPGNWVWLKSPTVVAGRKPYHMSVSIIGYKKRVN